MNKQMSKRKKDYDKWINEIKDIKKQILAQKKKKKEKKKGLDVLFLSIT